jgi:hypothetical protein
MKLTLFVLLFTGFAQANTYAPTLQSVVVLYDVAENEYSPFLYHSIMGEMLEMKMHPSCAHITVETHSKTVICISTSGKGTPVGVVGKEDGNEAFWRGYQVNWYNNVEILETKTKRGLEYSLKIK